MMDYDPMLSVSLDGIRLGNPVQECEAYAVLDPGAGLAAWLPTQAAWEAEPLNPKTLEPGP